MSESIGFIGLGALGAPIAANLLASGKTVTVWNRTASKAESLIEKGAKSAGTPSDAVPRSGVVFTILWDDTSLEEIVRSEGFLEKLGKGGVHVSMTTVTPSTVTLDSAISVATTTRRRVPARSARSCSAAGSVPCSGRTSTPGRPPSALDTARISPTPGRKTRTSPEPRPSA